MPQKHLRDVYNDRTQAALDTESSHPNFLTHGSEPFLSPVEWKVIEITFCIC